MNTYTLSKEESDRLNILKYIAIVFVVYIHSYPLNLTFEEGNLHLVMPQWLMLIREVWSQTVSLCAVPLFYLISAVLLFRKKRDYKTTIKQKVKTLLLPYLIWNSLWILVFILLQSMPFTSAYFSESPILQSSFAEWLKLYGIGDPTPMDYPLWYLRDLMVVTLFFPVIDAVAEKFPKQLFFVAAMAYVLLVSFPFKYALPWTCMGASLVKLQIHLTKLDHIALWKCLIVYILCGTITLLTDNPIIDELFIFMGILFWVRVSKWIFSHDKAKDLFLRLSEWTFMIFVAHEMTLASLKKVCLKLFPTEPIYLFAEYLFLPILVIAGCSIVGAILKRNVPKVYYLLTGTR